MLSEMGVKGLKIQEVLSLDDDLLAILPYVTVVNVVYSLSLKFTGSLFTP